MHISLSPIKFWILNHPANGEITRSIKERNISSFPRRRVGNSYVHSFAISFVLDYRKISHFKTTRIHSFSHVTDHQSRNKLKLIWCICVMIAARPVIFLLLCVACELDLHVYRWLCSYICWARGIYNKLPLGITVIEQAMRTNCSIWI